ncbi:hypothetical protein BKA69DRAFT_1066222 [Paraphysoderma sedebokerense]|nr:hypothetical protein BKA69DRAFT_1066222 [Paraphysoderma sedebokerense]
MSQILAYPTWILPTEFLPHNRAMILFSFLDIFSNFFLLVHFYKNRTHLNVSSATLVLIAVCDFVIFILCTIITISHDVAAKNELPWSFCQAIGFISIFALERYLRVIHDKKISAKQLCGMWLMAFSSSAIQAIIPLATETYFIPQDSKWYCLGDFSGTAPGHRAYSIFSLVSAYAACGIVTFAYYSIYRKTIADGFKMNGSTSVIVTKSSAGISKNGSDLRLKNSTAPAISTTLASNINSTPTGEVNLEQAGAAQQMRLTMRLAFYNCYFLAIWVGTVLSWTYQTISTNRVPPNLDYALTFIPIFGSVLNPIIVLTIDQRWKVQLPRRLQYLFFGRADNAINA